MKEIHVDNIVETVENLCITANCVLPEDIYSKLSSCLEDEDNELAKATLSAIIHNADIAKDKTVPICQDTGIAVVFVELGQDVHIVGGSLYDAINKGVSQGYTKGYLRASVVADPFDRVNTNDNTPAIIHTDIVQGDNLKITICPKGAGSENKSRVKMLTPADGIEGVKKFVIKTVLKANANSCPPMVIGVGIGSNLEGCALLAKKALLTPLDMENENELLRNLEEELLTQINTTNIGPGGLGGKTTALKVNILTAPTHIAQLPVAVNISCHATRHMSITL